MANELVDLKDIDGNVQVVSIPSGGTGLTASPSMLTNVGSTSAANVLAASPRPGITGTLAIGHGGTGATTAAKARTNLGIIDAVYPVGSIYMSVNDTNPGTLFGGTWVQLKDRFLLGVGDTYSNGATGGEATHQLTTSEMPSHDHGVSGWYTILASSSSGQTLSLDGPGYWQVKHPASQGSGTAHNNMPPYLAVYMWKRTA